MFNLSLSAIGAATIPNYECTKLSITSQQQNKQIWRRSEGGHVNYVHIHHWGVLKRQRPDCFFHGRSDRLNAVTIFTDRLFLR